MTFESESKRFGREPIELVEIETDACSLRFGESPCPATGEPCFNTWATCPVKTAYQPATKTYLLARPVSSLPVGFSCIPLVQSITYAPQVLTPAKGLGMRGAVTIRCNDSAWPDVADDPYHDQRPQGIDGKGTFWGRFRARHKYYVGRILRVLTGYLVNGRIDYSNFETRSYVIESIQGVDRNGIVTIVAKDVLKLADDNRAQCPRLSTVRLNQNLTDTDTSFTVYPAGVANSEFGASGVLRIGSELMAFSRVGDSFTVERAKHSTKAASAKIDDLVQVCAVFTSQPVQNLIYTLLVDYANIPSSYIDKPAWDAERNAHLLGVYSSIIADPVGVNTLISELQEQGQCYIWYDETASKILFKALVAPPDDLPIVSDENHFLSNSVDVGEATDLRQSQFAIRFDRIDPTKKLDDATNYRQRHLSPDLQSEGVHEHGSSRLRVINSRWFGASSLGRVQQLGSALLSRYRDPPRTLSATLDTSDLLKTGAMFRASTSSLQTASGDRELVPMQVVETRYDKTGTTVQIKAQELIWYGTDNAINPIVYIGSDLVDVNLLTLYQSEYGNPKNGQNITFVIVEGVNVISSQFGDFAMVTGDWTVDVTLSLIIRPNSLLAGRGGHGGGSNPSHTAYQMPQVGRNGLRVTYPIYVENWGIISGGGGGGGLTEHAFGGGGGAPFGAGGVVAGAESDPYVGRTGNRTVGGRGGGATLSTETGGDGGDLGQAGGNGWLGISQDGGGDEPWEHGAAAGVPIVADIGKLTLVQYGGVYYGTVVYV